MGGYWNGIGVAGDSLGSKDSSGKRHLSETGSLDDCAGLIVEACTGISESSRPSENSSFIGSLDPDIPLTVSNCHASGSDDERWSGLLGD